MAVLAPNILPLVSALGLTAAPPRGLVRCRQSPPLLDGILGTHGQIAPSTDGAEIGDLRCTTGGLRDIMTDVKVKHGHGILAPGDETLAFESATGILDPHLFAEGTWYVGLRRTRLLHICFGGRCTETRARTRTRCADHSILYRDGIIISPSMAAKNTTVCSRRPRGVAAPIGYAPWKSPPKMVCVNW
jgi:hypothetical protein